MRRLILVLACLTMAVAPAFAQEEDEEGCKDHATFSRMPSFRIASCEDQESSTHDAARLTTAGLGDTQPVADNTAEEGRAQNRRVVLVKRP